MAEMEHIQRLILAAVVAAAHLRWGNRLLVLQAEAAALELHQLFLARL